MSPQFVELPIVTGGERRETILLATAAIKVVRSDGTSKCKVTLTDTSELTVPGVSYDELKRKLGVA